MAELRTCGNGLGFIDTDPTFTLEQCEELHLVDCGSREQLEEPISTEHCPRLYGTYPDPLSCSVFWKCLDGRANRYECPPGLAYDAVSRGCKWADQVPECKNVVVEVEGEEEEFTCPTRGSVGAFTKHAHPSDCRQYFVCIGGVPREYGCPLGTVFNIGSDEFSGKCTDPEEVPECREYYGDLEFDKSDLSRAGFDTGRVQERVRSGSPSLSRNSINRAEPEKKSVRTNQENIKRRPAPPALQAIVDEPAVEIEKKEEPARSQFRPRPRPSSPNRLRPAPFEEKEAETEAPTVRPNRIQVLTDRPRTTFPRRQETTATERPTTVFTATNRPAPAFTATNRPTTTFTATSRPATVQSTSRSSEAPATTLAPVRPQPELVNTVSNGLPDPVPAKPGPDGEEYYYYYYYYDDEEDASQ